MYSRGRAEGVARNELRGEARKLIFDWSAQLGFSKGAASCTNLTRARPYVVRVHGWCLFKSRDFRRCVVRVSAAAADRCAQSGDPTRTEQGRSHVAARGSEFYRFTGSKSREQKKKRTRVGGRDAWCSLCDSTPPAWRTRASSRTRRRLDACSGLRRHRATQMPRSASASCTRMAKAGHGTRRRLDACTVHSTVVLGKDQQRSSATSMGKGIIAYSCSAPVSTEAGYATRDTVTR